jgi:hypothetical protein
MPASAEERLTQRKLLTLAGTAASGFALPTGSGRASGGPTSQLPSTQSGGRTEVDVIKISDGDTVDVRFDDGSEDTIRVIGVDTPEKEQFARFERPEEWEGFAYNPNRSTLERLSFSSSCSLFAADGTQLTADDQIAVWAAGKSLSFRIAKSDLTLSPRDEVSLVLVHTESNSIVFEKTVTAVDKDVS